jgi:hypothetical protein
MRKLFIAAGAALAVAAFVGAFLAPEKFPLDGYRYEAEWACMQSKPCASSPPCFRSDRT